jgi:sRNA-binding protein
LLAEHFPALFGAGRALPIKLRIQADIQQRVPGVFSRKSLSIFLHRHTTSTPYIKALLASPHRFDLDGQPAGEVADEHRAAAQAELERRQALVQARRAAERDAQREAQRQRGRSPQAPAAASGESASAGAAPGAAAGAPGAGGRDGRPGRESRDGRPPRPGRPGGPAGPQRPDGGSERRADRPAARSDAAGGTRPAGPRPNERPGSRHEGRPGGRHDGAPGRRPEQRHAARPSARADAHATHEPVDTRPSEPLSPEQAAEVEARRQRAAVLRAYETTTLTRANFCALKGMSDAALEAILVQARQDREQRTPRPAAAPARP